MVKSRNVPQFLSFVYYEIQLKELVTYNDF